MGNFEENLRLCTDTQMLIHCKDAGKQFILLSLNGKPCVMKIPNLKTLGEKYMAKNMKEKYKNIIEWLLQINLWSTKTER